MLEKNLFWFLFKHMPHTGKTNIRVLFSPIYFMIFCLVLFQCFYKSPTISYAQEEAELNSSTFNVSDRIPYFAINIIGGRDARDGIDALVLSKNYRSEFFGSLVEFGGASVVSGTAITEPMLKQHLNQESEKGCKGQSIDDAFYQFIHDNQTLVGTIIGSLLGILLGIIIFRVFLYNGTGHDPRP